MAFFEGLIETEDGALPDVAYVGGAAFYVIDDHGFRRHIDARDVDRVVLGQFLEQLQEHPDEAARAMLQLMGQDDLFTKAMVDATLRNINLEQILDQRMPSEARQWLGMLGFRVIVDLRGQVVRVNMPAAPADWDEE